MESERRVVGVALSWVGVRDAVVVVDEDDDVVLVVAVGEKSAEGDKGRQNCDQEHEERKRISRRSEQ